MIDRNNDNITSSIEEKIAYMIGEMAKTENMELMYITEEKQGIFHMPELAFAYACGKTIMKHRLVVFDTSEVTWHRERSFNSGPVDLVFECKDQIFAIEFKMRNTADAYKADIAKLAALEIKPDHKQLSRIFCALVDVFEKCENNDDGRLNAIDEYDIQTDEYDIQTERLCESVVIPTVQDWYIQPTSCVVGVWSVVRRFDTCVTL